MEFVWFLLIGLIAGVLAKAIMPGTASEPSGWLLTIVLGMVGAIVGGWVGSFFGMGGGGFIWQIVLATIGAIILLAIARAFTGRRAV